MIFLRMICSSLVRSSLLARSLLASGSPTHSHPFQSLLAHTPCFPFHFSIRPVWQHSCQLSCMWCGGSRTVPPVMLRATVFAPMSAPPVRASILSLAFSPFHFRIAHAYPFSFSLTHVPPPCSQPADQNLYSSLAESSTLCVHLVPLFALVMSR